MLFVSTYLVGIAIAKQGVLRMYRIINYFAVSGVSDVCNMKG